MGAAFEGRLSFRKRRIASGLFELDSGPWRWYCRFRVYRCFFGTRRWFFLLAAGERKRRSWTQLDGDEDFYSTPTATTQLNSKQNPLKMVSSLLSDQHHHQHPPRPRAGATTAAVSSPSRVIASSSSSVSFDPSSFALPSSAFSAPSATSAPAAPTASSSSSSIPTQLSPSIPSILKTFDSQTDVFITGGIGFVGSVVVEQLLRLTDVNKIFLLIRSKNVVSKGGDGEVTRLAAQQRLDAFVGSSALFDSLRVEGGEGSAPKKRPPRGVFEFGSGRG